ncbi:MAG: hypothetical protein SFV15_12300 [Polyangiaceae bacterium]|nr:hypothetical protein [Polyangiaceae bacterium]
MGRNDWQKAANEENFVAVSGAPKKGGVLPVLGSLLALGALGALVSYYLPLYRAHETLNGEYVKLAIHSREQQEKLSQAGTALSRVAAERDALKAERGGNQQDAETRKAALQALQKSLEAALATSTAKKLIALNATETGIEIQFQSPSLFKNDASAPTPAGKALLCSIAKAAGKAVRFEVAGSAAASEVKKPALKAFPSAWHLGVARGASAAQALAETCKLAETQLVASGKPAGDAASSAILALRLSL